MQDLTIDEISWSIECHPEDRWPDFDSISEADKAEIMRMAQEENIWAWCIVQVTGRWLGLKENEYLGGCSYENVEQFMADGYYADMQEQIRKELTEMAHDIAREVWSE